jgi:hypothetical protein
MMNLSDNEYNCPSIYSHRGMSKKKDAHFVFKNYSPFHPSNGHFPMHQIVFFFLFFNFNTIYQGVEKYQTFTPNNQI